jgi:hypothetical protein
MSCSHRLILFAKVVVFSNRRTWSWLRRFIELVECFLFGFRHLMLALLFRDSGVCVVWDPLFSVKGVGYPGFQIASSS